MTSVPPYFKPYLGSLNEKRGFILIADPDSNLTRRLQVSLEHEGWEVAFAPTGAEALALAKQSRPDVAVVGEGLEDMDWREVLALLILERPELNMPMFLIYLLDKRNVSSEEKEQRIDEMYLKKELAAGEIGDIFAIPQDLNPLELCHTLNWLAPDLGKSLPESPVDREERVRRLEAFLAKVRSERRESAQ